MATTSQVEPTAAEIEHPHAPATGDFPKPSRNERRACSWALQYWRDLANGRLFPTLDEVTQEGAADLWEHLFVVEVSDDPGTYKYVQAGSVLCDALGFDPTGRPVAEVLPEDICSRVMYFQRAATDMRSPIDAAGRWTQNEGEDVLFRVVLLPLSDDQEHPNYLLGAVSFTTPQ